MKIALDTEAGLLTIQEETGNRELPLYSPEAFELISQAWVKTGWALKYSYSFTWMGRPVVQLPEDLIRIQEAVFALQPDVIIETGVAHGGSLIFYASLCAAMGKGRVVGIDIEIRPHNREALEAHPMFDRITLIEGSSTDPCTITRVRSTVNAGDTVMVILDSNHTYAHVLAELEAYSSVVTPGSWIVATDGVMKDLADVPGGEDDWSWNNPTKAAADFVAAHPEFELQDPPRPFDEGQATAAITYWPGAWIRRIR